MSVNLRILALLNNYQKHRLLSSFSDNTRLKTATPSTNNCEPSSSTSNPKPNALPKVKGAPSVIIRDIFVPTFLQLKKRFLSRFTTIMWVLSEFGVSTELCRSIFARWEGYSIKKYRISVRSLIIAVKSNYFLILL